MKHQGKSSKVNCQNFRSFHSVKFVQIFPLYFVTRFLNYLDYLSKNIVPEYIESKIATGIVKRFLTKVENRTDKKLFAGRTIQKNGVMQLSSGKKTQLIIDNKLKNNLLQNNL